MKKTILTLIVALIATIGVTAQNFTVVTTYNSPAEGEENSVENFTNSIGVLYKCADNCSAGLVKNGEEYDLLARYNYSDNIYISAQAPTSEMMDNLSIGLGYSLSVWKGVCVEPNYTMPVNADDNGEREGSFNLGLSYRF
jgi:hypothetical protein